MPLGVYCKGLYGTIGFLGSCHEGLFRIMLSGSCCKRLALHIYICMYRSMMCLSHKGFCPAIYPGSNLTSAEQTWQEITNADSWPDGRDTLLLWAGGLSVDSEEAHHQCASSVASRNPLCLSIVRQGPMLATGSFDPSTTVPVHLRATASVVV